METRRNGDGSASEAARGWSEASSLDELEELVRTAGGISVGRVVQKRHNPNPALYIGRGKVDEIIARKTSDSYTMVVIDDELSPTQQRNLERALDVKVLDRTALILDIFAMRARSREGRLQVDLAQSEYLLPRLAGQWSHLERLGMSGARGAIGVRGPGETQLETDRRIARSKIGRLKKQIESVRKQRALHRRRRTRAGVPVVALVGYTNAGKSTLMHALTRADVRRENRLFATLDPVTRRIHLPSGGIALLSDTVGFIQKLPTQLVAAFQATLEELADADLLLHVIDITHPDAAQQSQTVDDTLEELGVADRPRISALNKVDLIVPEGDGIESFRDLEEYDVSLAAHRPEAVLVSATRGWGLDELLARIDGALAQAAIEREAAATR